MPVRGETTVNTIGGRIPEAVKRLGAMLGSDKANGLSQILREDLMAVHVAASEYMKAQAQVVRLQATVDELIGAADELGNSLFGPPENGHSWRDAKAGWWQRLKRAVESAEAARAKP
jgi:hypothetical protein